MKFIEVTERFGKARVLINLEMVAQVQEQPTSTCFTFCTSGTEDGVVRFYSEEFFSEICEKITNATWSK